MASPEELPPAAVPIEVIGTSQTENCSTAMASSPCLKRKRLDNDYGKNTKVAHVTTRHCCSGRFPVASNYLNYLKSGIPRRIMFYSGGEWTDFPQSVTACLTEAFRSRKSAVQLSLSGVPYVFDYLSMVLIKLKSGDQQSIAWVDEKEKCFFPAFIVEGGGLRSDESDGNLEDSISCLDCGVDEVAYDQACASQHEMIKEVIVESESPPSQRWLPAVDSLWPELVRLDRDGNAFHSVMRGFLSGMGTFASPSSVVEIFQVNPKASTSMDRRDMFVQQRIQTTTVRHSHANVRSAWYGASKENLSKILIHGFREGARLCKGAAYGTGIYLAPGNRSFSCANHCDVDEKGLQYMLLCRVIMGNVEQVTKGSRQYLPSKPGFDCGVDDLVRPKCYVVWGTHSSTNIHPDYVVCFKLSPDVRDYFSGLMDIESSKIVLTQNEQISSTTNPVVRGLQAPSRPTTPWVGFTTLLLEISDGIPPVARELLSLHLEEYKCRMISRKEFVLKLRLVVGNKLLLSAFERCKQNPSFYRAHKEEPV